MEEISKQPNIDSVAWLLVITLMQDYNEKEQLGEKIYKMNSLKGRVPENFHVGAQACAEEDKMIKEMSDQK